MADNEQKTKFQAVSAEIDKLINTLASGMDDVGDRYADALLDAQKKYAEQAKKDAKKIQEDTIKEAIQLQAAGFLKNEKERNAYAIAEGKKRIAEELDQKLKIAEKLSSKEQKALERQTKYKEKQLEIQNAKNAGDTKTAKKLQNELENEQKKDKKADIVEALKNGDAKAEFREKAKEKRDKALAKAVTDGLNKIGQAIETTASYQGKINAALQGSGKSLQSMSSKLNVISPYFKTADLYANMNSLVAEGIAANIEQRALLMTVKENIADTFDANSNALKRMVRIQQTDSTANRLGMEAYLTKFLNTYVQSTEYLHTTFDNVADNLFEASSMLGAIAGNGPAASAEFEYVMQKWLGILTGVGFSDQSATSIAQAIGWLGSGNIDSLSGNSLQNLLIFGANKSNIDYADLLSNGVNAGQANALMSGVVAYLQELAGYDNNVVKSQLSNIFGITTSDLVAIKNLSAGDIASVSGDMLSSDQMYQELVNQFGQIGNRLNISTMINNMVDNLTYGLGATLGSTILGSGLWAIAQLSESLTGGISIPGITAFGTGFSDLGTVENLVKLSAMVAGLTESALTGGSDLFGMIGQIGGALTGRGSSVLLDTFGLTSGEVALTPFGRQLDQSSRESGSRKSLSNEVLTNSGEDITEKAKQQQKEDTQKEIDEASEKAQDNDPVVKYLKEINFATALNALTGGSIQALVAAAEGEQAAIEDVAEAVEVIEDVQQDADDPIISIAEDVASIVNLLGAGNGSSASGGGGGGATTVITQVDTKALKNVIASALGTSNEKDSVISKLSDIQSDIKGILNKSTTLTTSVNLSDSALSNLNGVLNNISSYISTTSTTNLPTSNSTGQPITDIVTYLSDLEFESNFKKMTNDIESIKAYVEMISNQDIGNHNSFSTSGFTNQQFTF